MFPPSIKRPTSLANAPVFITGAPRCGSSWVGEILGRCVGSRYNYEPFNHQWVPPLRGQLRHFTYLPGAADVAPVIRQTAERAVEGRQTWKQLARAAYRGYWRAATRSARRVIIKDPTAALMSAWLSSQFDARVVFIMRHPCGFASSIDALDWSLGVNRLLSQPALMRDYLEPFRDALTRARKDKWLARGAIWASIHRVYTRQMIHHPDWLMYHYEDICNNPAEQFESMAQQLKLELSRQSLEKIHSLSSADNSDPGSTRRNSKRMPDVWQQRMSRGEVDAVMGIVNQFGLRDYTV